MTKLLVTIGLLTILLAATVPHAADAVTAFHGRGLNAAVIQCNCNEDKDASMCAPQPLETVPAKDCYTATCIRSGTDAGNMKITFKQCWKSGNTTISWVSTPTSNCQLDTVKQSSVPYGQEMPAFDHIFNCADKEPGLEQTYTQHFVLHDGQINNQACCDATTCGIGACPIQGQGCFYCATNITATFTCPPQQTACGESTVCATKVFNVCDGCVVTYHPGTQCYDPQNPCDEPEYCEEGSDACRKTEAVCRAGPPVTGWTCSAPPPSTP